jgi:hypothetical protein
MDWAELAKSSVVAAVITSIVAGIGFLVSSATARRINEDKLKLDRELAAKKADAELALAERKAALDRGVTLARRKSEVAEKVLADFYEVRRALEAIRSPMIWAEEMVQEDGVDDDVVKNDGYAVRRRMRQHADLFSRLEATRFSFGALFGHAAVTPYDRLVRVHNQVFHAAGDLLRYRNQVDLGNTKDHLRAMRRVAFALTQIGDDGGELPDPIGSEVEAIVEQVEATCRPALEAGVA